MKDEDLKVLDFIRNGGVTRRYHTWNVIQQQTVAEHSFNVALLVYWLSMDEGLKLPGIRIPLIMAALTHDMAERVMGDIPAPAKRAMPGLRETWGKFEQDLLRGVELDFETELNDEELHILKFADAADGCLYCCRERQMGNILISKVFENFWQYANEERNYGSNKETAVLQYIRHNWPDSLPIPIS